MLSHTQTPARAGTGVGRETSILNSLAPLDHRRRSPAGHLGTVEDRVGPHVRWRGRQHLLLAIDQIRGIKRRQFKAVSVRDRIRRAGFHAISAENAAVVIDVVHLRVALGATYPIRLCVLCGFDIDAVRWARGCTQETGHALFQTVLVALQDVHPAKALLELRAPQRSWAVRVVFDLRGLEHLHEGDAHPLGDCGDVLQNRHALSVYRKPQVSRWPPGSDAVAIGGSRPESGFVERSMALQGLGLLPASGHRIASRLNRPAPLAAM